MDELMRIDLTNCHHREQLLWQDLYSHKRVEAEPIYRPNTSSKTFTDLNGLFARKDLSIFQNNKHQNRQKRYEERDILMVGTGNDNNNNIRAFYFVLLVNIFCSQAEKLNQKDEFAGAFEDQTSSNRYRNNTPIDQQIPVIRELSLEEESDKDNLQQKLFSEGQQCLNEDTESKGESKKQLNQSVGQVEIEQQSSTSSILELDLNQIDARKQLASINWEKLRKIKMLMFTESIDLTQIQNIPLIQHSRIENDLNSNRNSEKRQENSEEKSHEYNLQLTNLQLKKLFVQFINVLLAQAEQQFLLDREQQQVNLSSQQSPQDQEQKGLRYHGSPFHMQFDVASHHSQFKTIAVDKVAQVIKKFPVVDTVLVLFMRAVLYLKYQIGEAKDFTKPLGDHTVYTCLCDMFEIEWLEFDGQKCKIQRKYQIWSVVPTQFITKETQTSSESISQHSQDQNDPEEMVSRGYNQQTRQQEENICEGLDLELGDLEDQESFSNLQRKVYFMAIPSQTLTKCAPFSSPSDNEYKNGENHNFQFFSHRQKQPSLKQVLITRRQKEGYHLNDINDRSPTFRQQLIQQGHDICNSVIQNSRVSANERDPFLDFLEYNLLTNEQGTMINSNVSQQRQGLVVSQGVGQSQQDLNDPLQEPTKKSFKHRYQISSPPLIGENTNERTRPLFQTQDQLSNPPIWHKSATQTSTSNSPARKSITSKPHKDGHKRTYHGSNFTSSSGDGSHLQSVDHKHYNLTHRNSKQLQLNEEEVNFLGSNCRIIEKKECQIHIDNVTTYGRRSFGQLINNQIHQVEKIQCQQQQNYCNQRSLNQIGEEARHRLGFQAGFTSHVSMPRFSQIDYQSTPARKYQRDNRNCNDVRFQPVNDFEITFNNNRNRKIRFVVDSNPQIGLSWLRFTPYESKQNLLPSINRSDYTSEEVLKLMCPKNRQKVEEIIQNSIKTRSEISSFTHSNLFLKIPTTSKFQTLGSQQKFRHI